MIQVGSGAAMLASNETTNAEKLEGGLDIIFNTPIGGWILGKAGKALYNRFGKKAVHGAIRWLEDKGIPATERSVKELLEKVTAPPRAPGMVPAGGGVPYRTAREITPRPTGSVSLTSGKAPKKAK
jgi:hypothetical protein